MVFRAAFWILFAKTPPRLVVLWGQDIRLMVLGCAGFTAPSWMLTLHVLWYRARLCVCVRAHACTEIWLSDWLGPGTGNGPAGSQFLSMCSGTCQGSGPETVLETSPRKRFSWVKKGMWGRGAMQAISARLGAPQNFPYVGFFPHQSSSSLKPTVSDNSILTLSTCS